MPLMVSKGTSRSRKGFGVAAMGRSLGVEAGRLAEQGPGDDEALDLAGALVDLCDLGVAVVALGRELLRVAVAAEHLDGLGGLAAGDARCEQLGLGTLDRVGAAGLLEPGCAPGHRSRRLDLGLHVGELLLDLPEAADRAAEGAALARI